MGKYDQNLYWRNLCDKFITKFNRLLRISMLTIPRTRETIKAMVRTKPSQRDAQYQSDESLQLNDSQIEGLKNLNPHNGENFQEQQQPLSKQQLLIKFQGLERVLLDTLPLLSVQEATKTFDGEKQQRKTRRRQMPFSLITAKPKKQCKLKYEKRGRKRKKKSIQQPVEVKPKATGNRKGLFYVRDCHKSSPND